MQFAQHLIWFVSSSITGAFRTPQTSRKGQGVVEYALIIAVVAIVVIGGLTVLSGGLNSVMTTITSKLEAFPI